MVTDKGTEAVYDLAELAQDYKTQLAAAQARITALEAVVEAARDNHDGTCDPDDQPAWCDLCVAFAALAAELATVWHVYCQHQVTPGVWCKKKAVAAHPTDPYSSLCRQHLEDARWSAAATDRLVKGEPWE